MKHRPLSIDIRHPLILKADDLVLLTREDGNILPDIPGFGLFYRDTCYLSGYELALHDTRPLLLMSADGTGIAAEIELTNSALPAVNGIRIPDHKLSIRRTLTLLPDGLTFVDSMVLTNFADRAVELALSLEFLTTFPDMFVLRGTPPGKRGKLIAPAWEGNVLEFCYEGADGLRRSLRVDFTLTPLLAPRICERTTAHFALAIDSRASQSLIVRFRVDERALAAFAPAAAGPIPQAAELDEVRATAAAHLLEGYARLESSSTELGRIIDRSLTDMALLEVRRGEHRFTAAGIPWFVGLFGRDSLLPTLQCLAFNPDLGACTARALARWQGRRDDEKTGEQPGKILHELRVGELAHLHEVPQTPSYQAVDSTLLFLIAIVQHVNWTGDVALFEELRAHVDAALGWLERRLEEGDGYVTYEGLAQGGQPINQSWRDSGTGVLRTDGAYPVPPLALVEVQGYAFQAMVLVAKLMRRLGEPGRAAALEAASSALRERFLRDFWMPAQGCYCLALERGRRQVESISSNTAQVLWTGIANPEHASQIAARILKPDMFSGWGVRTLTAEHAAFDPLAYQQGSVWAFDNSLIVSGLRHHGEDAAALRIAGATLDAANGFRGGRLPEFIAGHQRTPGGSPTHTPRADPVQAWSAAAVPFMLTELLGLRSDGFARQLVINRPLLPDGVQELMLHDVRAAGGRVSLRFARKGSQVEAEAVAVSEGLEVVIHDR